MPVVKMSTDIWERLMRWDVPHEAGIDAALRNVLNAAEEHLKCSGQTVPNSFGGITAKRLASGQKVPEEAYEAPILEALYELGGRGTTEDVLDTVHRKMKHLLGEADYKSLGNEATWRYVAKWVCFRLVQRGLLIGDSESGVWDLTSPGIMVAEVMRGQKFSSRVPTGQATSSPE